MSFRVTSRGRPILSDTPWAFSTNLTAINTSVIRTARPCDNAAHYNYHGPFPFKAIMEILYGVKKFTVNAAISGRYSKANGGATVSGTMVSTLSSFSSFTPQVVTTEVTAFEQRNQVANIFEPVDTHPTFGEVEFFPLLPGYELTNWPGYTSGPPYTSPKLLIIKDQNGEYWMDGYFTTELYATLTPPTTHRGHIETGGDTIEDYRLYTTGTLVLACGSYTFRIVADTIADDILSASLTITATEWFQYRTTAGVAAYNSATGLPINGGPGA